MKLAASLVVRNELTRYLPACIDHLLEFVDLVVVLDDASDDGTREYLIDHQDDRLHVILNPRSTFYEHEGRTRQLLVDATLGFSPTHVLSLDADEFVSDGELLRRRVEAEPQVEVWTLEITEVWKPLPSALGIREDGGWRTHPLNCLWRADAGPPKMLDKKLACRRVPAWVNTGGRSRKSTGAALLHFGWANERERQARYDRYTRHDGGRFHASSHLRSIMWDDRRVRIRMASWPAGRVFDGLRERLVGATVA